MFKFLTNLVLAPFAKEMCPDCDNPRPKGTVCVGWGKDHRPLSELIPD